MSKAFDAYHKWLGIPPEEQPPNHYRLLGLRDFENDDDAIENAAEGRILLLRSRQTGPNSHLCQRLLNDIATARHCLLQPNSRRKYNEQLRAESNERTLIGAPPVPQSANVQPRSESPPPLPAPPRSEKTPPARWSDLFEPQAPNVPSAHSPPDKSRQSREHVGLSRAQALLLVLAPIFLLQILLLGGVIFGWRRLSSSVAETDGPEVRPAASAEVDGADDGPANPVPTVDGGETADASRGEPVVDPERPSPEAPDSSVAAVDSPELQATPIRQEPEPPNPPPPQAADPLATPAPDPIPTPPPKPAPPANPFRKLASAVDLPPLGATEAPGGAAFEPQSLGELFLNSGELFLMDLYGGEFAATGTRMFTLVPNLKTERDWDVTIAQGGGRNLKIAAFALHDDQLFFQWTPEALEDPASPSFANCALGMRTGLATHTLALRTPLEVDPVNYAVSKTGRAETVKVDYTIDYAPSPDKIMVEIAAVEDMPAPTFDPDQKVPVDGEIFYMRFGGSNTFGVRTESKLSKGLRSKVTLTIVAVFKLGNEAKDTIYSDKDVQSYKQRHVNELQQLTVAIDQWTKQFQAKGTPAAAKTQLGNLVNQGTTRKAQLETEIKQLDAVIAQHDVLGGGGKIHFRIYYLAGEQQVNLVRSNALPAATPPLPP